MRVFVFAASTLLAGFFVQMALVSWWPGARFSPHIVLILTIAWGWLRGPLFAESMGFLWGLALDAMGMSLFGAQGLLLAIGGYLGGSLGRQVNAEEPLSQIAFTGLASILFMAGLYGLESFLGGMSRPVSLGSGLLKCVLNAALAPALFLAVGGWARVCGLRVRL